ncbi:MAG: transglycosylase domain-containing protein [Terriglobales bacterium]|jgi:penicillin-binding protein 1A
MLQLRKQQAGPILAFAVGPESGAVSRFERMRAHTLGAVRQFRRNCPRRWLWTVRLGIGSICIAEVAAVILLMALHYVYLDRSNLPDIGAFVRFEFPAIGHVYDANGQPLIELAKEHRQIVQYGDIPPVVRDAILAAEDKNFFSHNGVDYTRIPRVLSKVRIGALLTRFTRVGRQDKADSLVMLRQGGSTISQQLVRAYFLRNLTNRENSNELRPGVLSYVIGARSAKKLVRKLEEIRLSLWMEEQMQQRFGSKRRAKEEILARYASFLYMGDGQYGFAAASGYYFGRSLASFTVADADKAALLAGIAKSPRVYAPSAPNGERVLHRRNQILGLMVKRGFLSQDDARAAEQRPILASATNRHQESQAPAVGESVLRELKSLDPKLAVDDMLQGRIQIYSTVNMGVQQVVNQALERGLVMYEKRHPAASGIVQGSVIVLKNRDAGILAESGGREFYRERSNSYGDFNRVTQSLRQPGSAMKPFVYLAAFRQGEFSLESMVPDEPISVPDAGRQATKWISNYDGQFKGLIPLRQALAESRNAVAIWITTQIGIARVLRTARSLGVQTPLQPYATTALGASEVSLLELANAYRTMASGSLSEPHVIQRVLDGSGKVVLDNEHGWPQKNVSDNALALIQEGLRGVVRLPGGTAHALDSQGFPIAVMGKTGTTNDFKDALFVGSTYGPGGITVAVRIGFDDDRSLGQKETGARVALPVFKEIMLSVYQKKLVGRPPEFPSDIEERISTYLDSVPVETAAVADAEKSATQRP